MLVVSIHDVAPQTEAGVRWLLRRLDGLGVARRVLKVIPNQDGVGDLRHFPELAALLRDEAERGSEIVLHGYTHRQAGPWQGSAWDVTRARLFAGGGAEFLSLGEQGMRDRIAAGLAILTEVGLAARGFCAPGWLAGPGVTAALREAGLTYAVWLTGIEEVAGSRRHTVPATGYLGVGGPAEALAQIGGLLSVLAARPAGHLRIVLHPQGANRSPHAERALRLAGRLATRWPVGTYADLLHA